MNVTNFNTMNFQKILGLTSLFFGFGLLFLPLVHASDLSLCPPQGPFHDCLGFYTWTSGHREGDRYLGEFKNNKFHGYGTYLWAPNTKYVQSGSIYSGQWKNGVKDGQGTYIWADGDKFTGQWRGTRTGSVMEGFGIYTWNDGTVYSGQFSAKGPGKRGKHGNGKIVFSDGRSFEGRWINDLPSDGVLTGRTGQSISLDYGWDRGTFRAGRVFKIIISFEGGTKFIGEVDRQYNPTKGKFIDSSGNQVNPKLFSDYFKFSSFFQ